MAEDLLLRLDSVLHDPVTTTDELIPSGETSSYRSNPIRLSEFTLSRRDPGYVGRTRETKALAAALEAGNVPAAVQNALRDENVDLGKLRIASAIYAEMPGDGSAREQAASCQRVLGGGANLCRAFATKRYRSNCINWGILPLITEEEAFPYGVGDWVLLRDIRKAVASGQTALKARVLTDHGAFDLPLKLEGLTDEERQILLDGCLMNFYKRRNEA